MRTNWRFYPDPVNTLLTIIALFVFICLGLWQIERAAEKRENHDAFVVASEQSPLNIVELFAAANSAHEFAWRKAAIAGEYLDNATYILDNQVANGVAGYHILSGLKIGESDQFVLINRGWVPAGDDRDEIGQILPPGGRVGLTGTVYFPTDNWFIDETFSEQISEGVIRVQEVNIEAIGDAAKINFLPFIILLDADAGPGFSREWSFPSSNETRHHGYAFQWFMMAMVVLTIYIVTNLKSKK